MRLFRKEPKSVADNEAFITLIQEMKLKSAPAEFIEAIDCLLDDTVAAFAERQHEGYLPDSDGMSDKMSIGGGGVTYVPNLLLRSNPIHLKWAGHRWELNTKPPHHN